MAEPGGKGALAALIGLKIVCCGGLLLAFGVLSIGGLMSFFESPVVQVAGGTLVGAAVWLLVRQRAARRKADAARGGTCCPAPREHQDVP